MSDVASSSVQPPDVARLELGAPFYDSLVPRKVILPENGGVETPLWPPGASPGVMRLAVLGWLGRNSDFPGVEGISAADVHLVFSLPYANCFTLRETAGLLLRRARGGREDYTRVELGRMGGSGAGNKRQILYSAHRLVCSLKKGQPADPTWVAQHSCHRKTCVNPAHLFWGPQADNLRTSVSAGAAVKAVRRGATVCMTGFWCCGVGARAGGESFSCMQTACVEVGEHCKHPEPAGGLRTGVGTSNQAPGRPQAAVQECSWHPGTPRHPHVVILLRRRLPVRQARGSARRWPPWRRGGSASAPEQPRRRLGAGPRSGRGGCWLTPPGHCRKGTRGRRCGDVHKQASFHCRCLRHAGPLPHPLQGLPHSHACSVGAAPAPLLTL